MALSFTVIFKSYNGLNMVLLKIFFFVNVIVFLVSILFQLIKENERNSIFLKNVINSVTSSIPENILQIFKENGNQIPYYVRRFFQSRPVNIAIKNQGTTLQGDDGSHITASARDTENVNPNKETKSNQLPLVVVDIEFAS